MSSMSPDARAAGRRTHPVVLALFGLGTLFVLASVVLSWRYLTPFLGTAPRCLAAIECAPADVSRGLRNAGLVAGIGLLPWLVAMGIDAATRAPSPARRTDWGRIVMLVCALSPVAVLLGFLVAYVGGYGAGVMAALAVTLLLAHLVINSMPDGGVPLSRRMLLWFGIPVGALLGGLIAYVFTRPVLLGGIWSTLVYALFALLGPLVIAWLATQVGATNFGPAWRIRRRFRPVTD